MAEPKSVPDEGLREAERRDSRRIRLDLDTAVPVLIRSEDNMQWGLCRNASQGGMLIELPEPPPIGALIEIKLAGVHGSMDAPDAIFLHGEVRHRLVWNYGGDRMTAVGVRFIDDPAISTARSDLH